MPSARCSPSLRTRAFTAGRWASSATSNRFRPVRSPRQTGTERGSSRGAELAMIRSRNSGVTNSPRRRVANCEILRVSRAVRQFSRRWRSSSSARRTRTVSISPAKRAHPLTPQYGPSEPGAVEAALRGSMPRPLDEQSRRPTSQREKGPWGEGVQLWRLSTANAVVRRCSAPANELAHSFGYASLSFAQRAVFCEVSVELARCRGPRRLTCSMAASSSALAASAAVAAASRTNASKRSSCRTASPSRSRWQTGQGSPS